MWKRSDKNELTNTVKQICDIQSHAPFVLQTWLQEDPLEYISEQQKHIPLILILKGCTILYGNYIIPIYKENGIFFELTMVISNDKVAANRHLIID